METIPLIGYGKLVDIVFGSTNAAPTRPEVTIMVHPEITEEQREMVVVMLANALRKDAHLRSRAERARVSGEPLAAVMSSQRADSSRRYVDGMRDMVRVLFVDGGTVIDECIEEAYARAMGARTSLSRNGREFH
jgi:hypothetical protein